MTQHNSNLIPEQHTGKAIDAQSTRELSSDEEARSFFETVKTRLADVNAWKNIAGNLSASFQLVDPSGNEVNRHVQKGDYFKIDIPGPGTKSGEGYDWVQVEELEHNSNADTEVFGIRVRPASNPQNAENNTSHFYSPESTSSFTVQREGNKITAAIYDRNIKPNDDAGSTLEKIRDKIVGFLGQTSFSKIQWKSLADGLIKRED